MRWAAQEQPYPEPEPGVRFRLLQMPVRRPAPPPVRTVTAVRRDGTTCDLLATLGARPRPAPDPLGDDAPGWFPWPP